MNLLDFKTVPAVVLDHLEFFKRAVNQKLEVYGSKVEVKSVEITYCPEGFCSVGALWKHPEGFPSISKVLLREVGHQEYFTPETFVELVDMMAERVDEEHQAFKYTQEVLKEYRENKS